MTNRNVFIVHGHDTKALTDLRDILADLGMHPIILKDKPDMGLTIIEKFERYANGSVFAFVLLTPDDRQAAQEKGLKKFRARQNVIFEMGWFFHKLGRARTRLVHKGIVELPSDITGVIYIEFKNEVAEIREQIRAALFEGGLIEA